MTSVALTTSMWGLVGYDQEGSPRIITAKVRQEIVIIVSSSCHRGCSDYQGSFGEITQEHPTLDY